MIAIYTFRKTEAYLKVAGKLYVSDLYKRVYGSEKVPHLSEHIAKMHSLAAYRKWSYTEEEINEIDIENNPKIKFTTKGGIEKLKKRVAREKKEKNNKKER